MSQETTKARARRLREQAMGGFNWNFMEKPGVVIVDVGAGDDPWPGSTPFDKEHGDANHLSNYFKAKTLDVIHASHVLEHMHDPHKALLDWFVPLKKGGHIVCTVPDVGAYERFTYPSLYNPDHKSSFSMIYRGSSFPIHCYLPEFVHLFDDIAECLLVRYVEVNYNWKLPREIDQTWKVENGCEIWNEFVLKKK